jgi:hypothetical protein
MGEPLAPGTATIGGNVVTGNVTAQEFRCGVKRDISNYADFKDDEHFSNWNRNFKAQHVRIIHILS